MNLDNSNLNNRMVIYTGCSDTQHAYGTGGDPREVLVVGSIYQVVDLDIRSTTSTIRLDGIDGRFNTVLFEEWEEDDDGSEDDDPQLDRMIRIGEITIEIMNLERERQRLIEEINEDI